MEVETWSVSKVRPFEKNPRKNDAAVDAVAASITEFGFRVPIVVDKKGVVIAGHTRLKAALKLGLQQVPVHVAKDLSGPQVRALRIADNKLHELSSWDSVILKEELDALRSVSYDLSLLGFSTSELEQIDAPPGNNGLVDPDSIPAPPEAASSRPGDVYILGNHRLMCGDSSKPDDLDRLIDGARIHLVNMDPPYNVKVESRSNNSIASGASSYQGSSSGPTKGTTAHMRAKDRPLANDFVSDGQFEGLLSAWFSNVQRVLIPGGSFYIWGGYTNCGNYPPALELNSLKFAQAIIWVKEHPVMIRKDFMGNHEWCFYGWREGAAHRFFGPKNVPDTWTPVGTPVVRGDRIVRMVEVPEEEWASLPSDVWRVKKLHSSKMVHLTEKPVELACRAMKYSSLPGENVLDLFGGSGSTMIAAEMVGRRSFSMELDTLYCDVIVKRWEEFTGRKAELVRGKDDCGKVAGKLEGQGDTRAGSGANGRAGGKGVWRARGSAHAVAVGS